MTDFRITGSLHDMADQIIQDFKHGIRHKYYVKQGIVKHYWPIIGIQKGDFVTLYNPFLVGQPIEVITWLPFMLVHQQNINAASVSVDDIVRLILQEGRRYHFEDGMETPFSKALVSTAICMPEILPVLKAYLHTATVANVYGGIETVAEAMRWIGQIEDRDGWEIRRELLESFLVHPSARVRDGAGLGLASMDDPAAIPALEAAIKIETIKSLEIDLRQVLKQLVKTQGEKNDHG